LESSGSAVSETPFRFSSKYFEPESGLYYFGYRFYNPELGRWLSRDPVEFEDGMNLYEAFGGNPFRYIDPLGSDIIEQDSFEKFITSLETKGLPVQYLRKINDKIYFSYLGYGGVAAAKYFPPGEIQLKDYLFITTKSIPIGRKQDVAIYKRLPFWEDFIKNVWPQEFGQLLHEAWHAYLINVIKKDAELNKQWKNLVKCAPEVFYQTGEKVPESEKEEFIDEAVGMKLEQIFKQYMEAYLEFKKWGEKGITSTLKKHWEDRFGQTLEGYTTKGLIIKELRAGKAFEYPQLMTFVIEHILENKLSREFPKLK
jgi:RHS repeat-associated protein